MVGKIDLKQKAPEKFQGLNLYRRWESNPHGIATTGF